MRPQVALPAGGLIDGPHPGGHAHSRDHTAPRHQCSGLSRRTQAKWLWGRPPGLSINMRATLQMAPGCPKVVAGPDTYPAWSPHPRMAGLCTQLVALAQGSQQPRRPATMLASPARLPICKPSESCLPENKGQASVKCPTYTAPWHPQQSC